MASTSARRQSTRGPAAQTILPDEIWEEIFLRLDAAADLARASAACSSFRRVVSERRFLRRFRSLHSPPVLGFIRYEYRQFLPVGPPHRSSREAHALVQAGDFTFSFLPNPHSWHPRGTHDGLVLFSRSTSFQIQFRDFLVCDPLHRRYVKIPRFRIPDDLLAASIPGNGMAPDVLSALVPAGEHDDEEWFRVICVVQLKDEAMAFLFSSCNKTWQSISSMIHLPKGFIGSRPYYAHNCIHWVDYHSNGYSLMLDTSGMKFSVINLPLHHCGSMCAIVEAEGGRLGFLTIGDGTVDLYCKNCQRNAVEAQEWEHEKLIPLPKDSGINYRWNIQGIAGRYVALVVHHTPPPNSENFVLDMKTLLVEKLCTSNDGLFYGYPYARFPPLLALPSI